MPKQASAAKLDDAARESLIETLRARFEANPARHEAIAWDDVRARLDAAPAALATLAEMERTGGEPDAVGRDGDAIVFFDCARQSPDGRRSLCYDADALAARKQNKPAGSAVGMAEEWGAELLTKEQYDQLQALGEVDTKTSSWLRTPDDIRARGGAIFGDFRYGTVFTYHNGVESYYAGRGFRCVVRV